VSFPKLTLLGDKERDAQIIKKAKREVRGWRIRSVLLALIAGLFFFRLRMLVLGAVFVVLAFGALQISRLIVKRTIEMQKKLTLLEKR
jgi:Na+-translocating ferredoxin:NAD+ oxidoreductase RnfD subunit